MGKDGNKSQCPPLVVEIGGVKKRIGREGERTVATWFRNKIEEGTLRRLSRSRVNAERSCDGFLLLLLRWLLCCVC